MGILGKNIGAGGLCPNCEYSELGNKVKGNKIVSYGKTKECSDCAVQRVKDKESMEKQRKVQDGQILISKRAQDNAKDELVSEGKIVTDKDGNYIAIA